MLSLLLNILIQLSLSTFSHGFKGLLPHFLGLGHVCGQLFFLFLDVHSWSNKISDQIKEFEPVIAELKEVLTEIKQNDRSEEEKVVRRRGVKFCKWREEKKKKLEVSRVIAMF